MVVIKQCRATKSLTKLHISMSILIAGISLILSTKSEGLSRKLPQGNISEFFVKSGNSSLVHFPESEFSRNETFVQGTPLLQLGNFINSTDQTIVSTIKKEMSETRLRAVILNDNDTQHDTQNTSYINSNVSNYEFVNSISASKLQAKSMKLHNNELSKRSTIIFLISVALVSTFFYVLLVSLRVILERKYGDKELLVEIDEVKRDAYY